jgi:hypothetical protein
VVSVVLGQACASRIRSFWRCSLPEPATVIKKLKEKMTGFEGQSTKLGRGGHRRN